MSDSSTTELEIKLAFLERHQEEQDKIILALSSELASLQREFARLRERLAAPGQGPADAPPAQERPPHY